MGGADVRHVQRHAHVCAMVYIAAGVKVDLNLFAVRISTVLHDMCVVCEAKNDVMYSGTFPARAKVEVG